MKTSRVISLRYGLVSGLSIAVFLAAPQLASQQESESTAESAPSRDAPVFTEVVDVNAVDLYVSVLDKKGAPVSGLTADDFVVEEDGRRVEVTAFFELSAGASDHGAPGSTPAEPPQLVLVFDTTSLEKRHEKRILDNLAALVDRAIDLDGSVMVATLGPELGVVQSFVSDASLIAEGFERVLEQGSRGESTKSSKQVIRRKIQSTPAATQGWSSSTDGGRGSSGPSGSSVAPERRIQLTGQQAQQVLGDIENLRRREYIRLGKCLMGLDLLGRGVSGLPGRKDVVWIGEDMLMQPGLDLFQMFYAKFPSWAQDLNLDQPEIWAEQVDLRPQFEYLAGVAQAGNVVFHVVDLSDRSRESGEINFDTLAVWSEDVGGVAGTPGRVDMRQLRHAIEGSRYLAEVTGGSFFGGGRKHDRYFDDLQRQLGAYYLIGYQRAGAPDGKLHTVSVSTLRGDLEVRTPERVLNSSKDHRLATMAISRLLIDAGPNTLGLRLLPGASETTDGDRYIQEVAVAVPSNSLRLQTRGDEQIGQLSVVLVGSDAHGNPTPPRLMQMEISIPPDKVDTPALAMARLRLMMEAGATEVAAAIRDEGSGVTASALLRVVPPPGAEGSAEEPS